MMFTSYHTFTWLLFTVNVEFTFLLDFIIYQIYIHINN